MELLFVKEGEMIYEKSEVIGGDITIVYICFSLFWFSGKRSSLEPSAPKGNHPSKFQLIRFSCFGGATEPQKNKHTDIYC